MRKASSSPRSLFTTMTSNDCDGLAPAAEQLEISAELDKVSGLAMKRGPSVDFCGYWQRGRNVGCLGVTQK
jgi:hypothetical protein